MANKKVNPRRRPPSFERGVSFVPPVAVKYPKAVGSGQAVNADGKGVKGSRDGMGSPPTPRVNK
jgi:hypothetical protein